MSLDKFVHCVTEDLFKEENDIAEFVYKGLKGDFKYAQIHKTLGSPKNKGNVGKLLEGIFNLPLHTVGWGYVLGYVSNQDDLLSKEAQVARFVEQVRRFFQQGEAEVIRLLGPCVADIVRRYSTIMRKAGGQHAVALCTFLQLIMATLSGGQSHMLTIAHVEYVETCVAMKRYAEVVPVVEQTVVQVHRGGLSYLDNLRYHYNAGLTFCGYKRWKDALGSFLNALTAPSEGVSAIQHASFKKYCLVSLLAYGKFVDLPKFTNSAVTRHLPKMSPAYVALTKAFKKGLKASQEILANNAERFTEDKNFGLTQQAVASIPKWQLLTLPKVYVSITLDKVAAITDDVADAQQARAEIAVMIAASELNAVIEGNVVRFSAEDVPPGGIPRLMATMGAKIQALQKLSEATQAVSESIRVSKSYIKKTMQGSPGGAAAAMGGLEGDAALAQRLQNEQYTAMGMG